MKRLNLLSIVTIVLLTMTGCDREMTGTMYYKSYIDGVMNADSVKFEAKGSLITTRFTDKKPRMTQQEHQDFCKSYGDWGYNREDVPAPCRFVLTNKFSSIEIFSDSDFNNFKAGESLKSITKLFGRSPLIYIKSGYKKRFDWENNGLSYVSYGSKDPKLHPVINTLDKIIAEDMILLNPFICFEFTEVPTIKEHNFTITFIEGENRFSNTLRVVFAE